MIKNFSKIKIKTSKNADTKTYENADTKTYENVENKTDDNINKKISKNSIYGENSNFPLLNEKINEKEINMSRNQRIKFEVTKINFDFHKESVAFTMMWLFIGFSSIYLQSRSSWNHDTAPGFTLIVASIYCFVSAIKSVSRYFYPYLIMNERNMLIRDSLFSSYNISYMRIKGTTYKNEIVGLVTYDGHVYNVSLNQMNEDSQKQFLLILKNRMDYVRGVVFE